MDEVSSQVSSLSRPSAKSIYCKLTALHSRYLVVTPILCMFMTNTELLLMINSAKDGVCSINKQDDEQISVQSGGITLSIQMWPFLSDTVFNVVFGCLSAAAALVHVWPGREGLDKRSRLCAAAEAAGRDGPCVGSEHAAGVARGQPAAHRHRNQGQQRVRPTDRWHDDVKVWWD